MLLWCVLKLCVVVSVAVGPAETGWASDPASGACRREPDAGAARQDGGRQHQNEAPNGGDLRAFNRQRQAVVQVEVTSCLFFPLSLPQGTGEMVWSGADEAAIAACRHFFASPYHIDLHDF